MCHSVFSMTRVNKTYLISQSRNNFAQCSQGFVDVRSLLQMIEYYNWVCIYSYMFLLKCCAPSVMITFKTTSNTASSSHLESGSFSSGGVGSLAAGQVHQADLTDLRWHDRSNLHLSSHISHETALGGLAAKCHRSIQQHIPQITTPQTASTKGHQRQ